MHRPPERKPPLVDGEGGGMRAKARARSGNMLGELALGWLHSEMACLYGSGFSLIPLGAGEDGKAPLVRFAGKKRLPLTIVQQHMVKAESAMYGIRLRGLVVVDIDTDTPEARDYVERRFGGSTVTVKTPRGLHHWYRLGKGRVPSRIRDNALAIDFKRGANQYVVGPGSIRPDGGAYVAELGILKSIESLPVFYDREAGAQQPCSGKVPEGQRTFHSWSVALSLVECCDSEQELFEELCSVRDWEFENPGTYPDSEIAKCAKYTWDLRLKGELWGGAMSSAKIHHHEILALQAQQSGSDALSLLHVLHRNHAAKPGKRFAIASHEMAKAGVVPNWRQWRYHQAKETLLQVGLLRRVKKGGGTAGPSLYQLCRLPLASSRIQGEEGF